MRASLASTVALTALLALSACGGGGGGGGGPVAQNPTPTPTQPTPVPMPPATVAGDCTGSPGQIACLTTTTALTGPSASLTIVGTSTSSTLQNTTPGVSVTITPFSTPSTTDDAYVVSFVAGGVNYSQAFGITRAASDPLGAYRTVNTATANFFVFDLNTALGGSLDYVQLAAYDRAVGGNGAELGFIAFGRQTAAADMPTTGTARFTGASRGVYISSGQDFFTTRSDVTMDANFGTGSVTGSASNFRFMTQNGVLATRSERPDFTFSASIAAGTPRFSGSATSAGLGISGGVEGAFFGGAGRTPEEAGFTYRLGTPGSGAFLYGGAVLGRSQ